MSDLYLGAYWGARQESAEQCTERLTKCLKEFATVSDLLAVWYERGKSRRDALKRPVGLDSLLKLVESGRNRRDVGKTVIEKLGFHVGIWNGASEERSMSFSMICGSYSQNPNLCNSIVLSFPEILGELGEKEAALKTLVTVVRAWEPDSGGIISTTSRNLRPFTPGVPFVDWMLYINRLDIDQSKLPASASVVNVDNLGIIIVTQDNPIDANNESHVHNVHAVEAAIRR